MAEMPEDQLEPLITECPSCQTRFRISEKQLERARGRVRCGACLTVFHGGSQLVLASLTADQDPEKARQALDDLLDELAGNSGDSGDLPPPRVDDQRGVPAKPAAERHGRRRRPAVSAGFEAPPEAVEPPGPPADSGPPAGVHPGAEARDALEGPGAVEPAAEPEPRPGAEPEPESEEPASGPAPAPAVAAGRDTVPVTFGEPRRRRPLVWLGIAAALLLLLAQMLWYQFDDWAGREGWRPVYGAVCSVLGCELPVQQDTAQLTTRNLIVRTHPGEPRALLVNAVIVNRADFPQPFPVLELQFTTVRGNLAASRRFAPDEYLAGDARGMELMPPRTPVQIELTMDDPGPDAVNYRLNFR